MVQRFRSQPLPGRITIYSDSDHAGGLKTRKGNSCFVVCFGDAHDPEHSNDTDCHLPSPGESESYEVIRRASIGIGPVRMACDRALTCAIRWMS